MTNYIPPGVSPLPFGFDLQDAVVYQGESVLEGRIVAGCGSYPKTGRYLAHAANTYPELCEALENLVLETEDAGFAGCHAAKALLARCQKEDKR